MQQVQYSRLAALLTALVAVVALVLSGSGGAADEPQPDATPPAQAASQPAETAKDPYAVPGEQATAQEITLFMRRLGRMEPPELSQAGFIDHFNKVDAAIDTILGRDLDEGTLALASSFKFEVLSLLEQIGDETASKRRSELIARLSKDERPALASQGRRFGFLVRIQELPDLADAERQQLVDDLAAFLQEGEITFAHLGLAMQAASILEQLEPQQAVAAYNLFAKYVETASDPQLAAEAETMRGSARRLDLPGNVIEISGTTFSGEDFNIKQYKGKVVLVDFWATWCGPCVRELPNVLDNYRKYHDKGFEVVGVSLDDNPEALEQFLAEREIPWVTLFEADEEKRAEGNAIARYYGITGIPTMILVNQEGKVVSLEARADELDRLLEELLGPPAELPEEEAKPASKGARLGTRQPLIIKPRAAPQQ